MRRRREEREGDSHGEINQRNHIQKLFVKAWLRKPLLAKPDDFLEKPQTTLDFPHPIFGYASSSTLYPCEQVSG